MEEITIIFIFLIILAIPGFLAYLIGLFANKKMVTVSWIVLLAAEILILANTIEFGR